MDLAIAPQNGQRQLIASKYGHFDIVKLLLDQGADVKLKDNQGQTALTKASARNNIKIVELLKISSTESL
ncbi:MAG: ankyrin repeat domain-containing protein [Chloroflexi bacterium]|nr:ankyrin repeat domain-containing protein [Chloroflexota bacterium]